MTYKAYLFLHLDFATGQVNRASIMSDKSPTTELGKGLLVHPPGFEASSESSWGEAESLLLKSLKDSIRDNFWGDYGNHVRAVLWDNLLDPMRNR